MRTYHSIIMLERIQKILSARGIASRRKAEEYIGRGLVKVNGVPAVIGQKADPSKDAIEVDGKVLDERAELLYYVMNKPVGVVTSNIEKMRGYRGGASFAKASEAREDERIVRNLLPPNLRGKIFPVGRLDKDSSGLLIFTNDGALAYRLTHPKFDHAKEYLVTTERDMTNGQLAKIADGLMILGERTKPATVKRIGRKEFSIVLTEGKNRQIRRMVEKVGGCVRTLRRVRIVTLANPKLKPGAIRNLTEKEKRGLLEAVGL